MVMNKTIASALKAVLLGCLLLPVTVLAQNSDERAKIAASQTGASPIFFDTAIPGIPSVDPGNFNNSLECSVRDGFPALFEKLNKGNKVLVAFIGGSITQANFGYRLQTARYLEQTYPQASFQWINAGVSGTGTDLGAFRIAEQVLQYKPDLIFIEFAVNGAYAPGMEGMIRQAIKVNPNTAICLLYTILNGQTAFYQKNELPPNIKGLEKVAAHYGLPAINLGMEAASLEAAGKLTWKGKQAVQDKILFSEDGIHPTTAGGKLYAAAIARAFKKIKAVQQQPKKKALRAPLTTTDWDKATMINPSVFANQNNGWQLISTEENPNLKKFNPWFSYVLTASNPGVRFSFRFRGDMLGIFDVGGPEAGQLEWIIDGRLVKLMNRFNGFCNNRYRGQFEVIEVPKGNHLVEVILSGQKADKLKILPEDKREDIIAHPEKYNQAVAYIGRILLRGMLLK